MQIFVRTEQEIRGLILANLTVPLWVEHARNDHKDWKALFYGEEFKEKLLRIEHIESEKRSKARKKFARPIKDLNQKLTKPIDNIYSAVGGSKLYPGLKTEDEKAKFLKQISNIRENKSLEKFLETYWAKDLYIVDPSGIIFLEYYNSEWIRPTYKSILSIRNYECHGQKLSWLLFEPIKEKAEEGKEHAEYWRYVDSENDMLFKKQGEDITLVKEKSFPHPFGEVPGLTCSNISRLGIEHKLSPFDCVKEDQEEFMRDQSIMILYKFLNGFVIPVRPAVICNECRGTGKNDHQECKTCHGTGKLMEKDVTDEIIIPIDLNNLENFNMPQNLGYYITPDIEIWDKYEDILEKKTMSEYEALWGMTIEKEQQKTATEVVLNAQPKINKLNEWSDVAQFMEWQLTEWIANWMFPLKDKEAKVSNIYYGRVYLLRTTEQITKELSEAIKNGMPDSIKNKLFLEYLTTKYKNDPETLSEELKRAELEYWPFYSAKDVKEYLGSDSVKKKLLFGDWWESLTEADKAKDVKKLEGLRDTWMEEKLKAINEKNIENQNMFNQNNQEDKNGEDSSGKIGQAGQGRGPL